MISIKNKIQVFHIRVLLQHMDDIWTKKQTHIIGKVRKRLQCVYGVNMTCLLNSRVKDWLAKLPSHIDSNLELHFGFPQDRDTDAKTTLKNLICGRLRKTYNPLFKVGNH